MALSEYERRALEQIARSLEHDYPKLASRLGPEPVLPATRHTGLGIFGAVVGCLILLTAVAVQALVLGVIGFTIMGAGTYLATMRIGAPRLRRRPAPAPTTGPPDHG